MPTANACSVMLQRMSGRLHPPPKQSISTLASADLVLKLEVTSNSLWLLSLLSKKKGGGAAFGHTFCPYPQPCWKTLQSQLLASLSEFPALPTVPGLQEMQEPSPRPLPAHTQKGELPDPLFLQRRCLGAVSTDLPLREAPLASSERNGVETTTIRLGEVAAKTNQMQKGCLPPPQLGPGQEHRETRTHTCRGTHSSSELSVGSPFCYWGAPGQGSLAVKADRGTRWAVGRVGGCLREMSFILSPLSLPSASCFLATLSDPSPTTHPAYS